MFPSVFQQQTDSTTMDTEQLELKYKQSKVCGICGDKALGYNFNAVTCEACKAFFRRNALRNKDFKCPFDGNCKIDLVTRRFCQKCRLKKCFDIGMKKEWILSEEEKKVKRDKIIENRRKKEHSSFNNFNDLSQSSETTSIELKSPTHCLNSDLLPSAYPYSDNKDLLYLFEPYQQQYQNYLSNKSFYNKGVFSKETIESYSTQLSEKSLIYNLNESIDSNSIPALRTSFTSSLPINNSVRPVAHESNTSADKVPNSLKQVANYEPYTNGTQQLYGHSQATVNNRKFQLDKSANYRPKDNQCIPPIKSDANPSSNLTHQYKTSQEVNRNGTKIIDYSSSKASPDKRDTAYCSYYSADKTEDLSFLEQPVMAPNSTLMEPYRKPFEVPYPTISTNSSNVESSGYLSSDDDHRLPKTNYCVTNDLKDLTADKVVQMENSNASEVIPKINDQTVVGQMASNQFNFSLTSHVNKPCVTFNMVENLRMQELICACESIKRWTRYETVKTQMSTLNEIYGVAEIIINQFIAMAKMISTFNELCQMDQIALLKGSVIEMIILQSVLTYVPEKDAWIFNLSQDCHEAKELKYNTCLKLIHNEGFYEEIKYFLLSFPDEYKRDVTLFELMTVIVLFTPNRTNIKHNEIIKLEHLTYRHLLQKYIEIHYASDIARTYFTTLMKLIDDLHMLNEKIKQRFPFNFVQSLKINL